MEPLVYIPQVEYWVESDLFFRREEQPPGLEEQTMLSQVIPYMIAVPQSPQNLMTKPHP